VGRDQYQADIAEADREAAERAADICPTQAITVA
jgi:ferredoxin